MRLTVNGSWVHPWMAMWFSWQRRFASVFIRSKGFMLLVLLAVLFLLWFACSMPCSQNTASPTPRCLIIGTHFSSKMWHFYEVHQHYKIMQWHWNKWFSSIRININMARILLNSRVTKKCKKTYITGVQKKFSKKVHYFIAALETFGF